MRTIRIYAQTLLDRIPPRDSKLTVLEFHHLLNTHAFCRGQRRIVTVAFRVLYKSAFTLHNNSFSVTV